MVKLKSKIRFYRSLFMFFRCGGGGSLRISNGDNKDGGATIIKEIEWELRPGGMLVQKRDIEGQMAEIEGFIMVRVVTGSLCHDISIQATSTFGEMKMMLSMVTGVEPNKQRLSFKGKEREDIEYLHLVGVKDRDKIVMLEDPAIKESKFHGSLPTTNDIMELLTMHYGITLFSNLKRVNLDIMLSMSVF